MAPISNLWNYTQMGRLVTFSGGKGLRGPVHWFAAGRKDLIKREKNSANSNTIGRGLKVARRNWGLVAAVDWFRPGRRCYGSRLPQRAERKPGR
jgi:seryl-tRNA(Sec) selenium transferase